MKSEKTIWLEEAGVINPDIFPFLRNRTTVVIDFGRCVGKSIWIKRYLDECEKQKKQESKFPPPKSKFHKSKKRS